MEKLVSTYPREKGLVTVQPYHRMERGYERLSAIFNILILAGYQGVIVRGLGVSQVLPEVGVLMVFAGCFFVLALSRFRFH